MQMGKDGQLPCYSGIAGKSNNHCLSCKRAKLHTPKGEVPRLGTVWCEKRHIEVNKMLSMECFE
jgi:hypothetical protein